MEKRKEERVLLIKVPRDLKFKFAAKVASKGQTQKMVVEAAIKNYLEREGKPSWLCK